MRVLFVANRCPGALTRGDQLRAFEHIRHLSRRHAITLLCFDRDAPPQALAALETCCERVIVAPRNRIGMAWRALAALPTTRPLQVAMHDALPPGLDLPALLAEGRFDLVHLQMVRTAGLVPHLCGLPIVVDLVDALSLNMARRAALDRGPLAWIARLEATRLQEFERHLCASVSAVAVCADADRAAIGADGDRVHLVGNGVDPDIFAPPTDETPRDGIVFVGNLGYFPNVDAAGWFARDVLPTIRAQRRDACLRLVGARPAPALQRLAHTCDGVDLIGPVADVRPSLWQAAVAVVPLRAGSGQQLKLLEAMAAGTPVVSTSLSAAGLAAVHGEHLLVADTPAAFADAVLQLLRDPAHAQRLAAAARDFVLRHWAWERSAASLERLWSIAAERKPV